jgi:hypothetical protein
MALAREQKFRLIEVLRDKREDLGSYDNLSSEIKLASGGVTVDRRKLKNLVSGGNVSLKISELKALDAYLAPLGEGLAAKPIFEQSAILAELAQSVETTFFLGSFPRGKLGRIDISHWDVRSMIEILRSLNHYGQIHIDIEEVIYRPEKKGLAQDINDETWFERLKKGRGSLVCVGSPRVNRATEVVLSEMFGVAPFQAPPVDEEPSLPFKFIWPKDRADFVSHFSLDGSSIEGAYSVFAKEISAGNPDVMGMSVDGCVLPVNRGGEKWLTYGIIAAQRRYTGQVWLALAGLSGTSTFGAAHAAKTIVEALPRAETGKNSAVLWAVVETAVEKDTRLSGDKRIVTSQQIIHGPHFWQTKAHPAEAREVLHD